MNRIIGRSPVLIPRLMKQHKSPVELITALYIRVLSRQPSETELRDMLQLVTNTSDDKAAWKFYAGIALALVNSNEFIFNH